MKARLVYEFVIPALARHIKEDSWELLGKIVCKTKPQIPKSPISNGWLLRKDI